MNELVLSNLDCSSVKPPTHQATLYAHCGDRRKSPSVPASATVNFASEFDRRDLLSKSPISGMSDIGNKINWQSSNIPAATIEIVNRQLERREFPGTESSEKWPSVPQYAATKFAVTSVLNRLVCRGLQTVSSLPAFPLLPSQSHHLSLCPSLPPQKGQQFLSERINLHSNPLTTLGVGGGGTSI